MGKFESDYSRWKALLVLSIPNITNKDDAEEVLKSEQK